MDDGKEYHEVFFKDDRNKRGTVNCKKRTNVKEVNHRIYQQQKKMANSRKCTNHLLKKKNNQNKKSTEMERPKKYLSNKLSGSMNPIQTQKMIKRTRRNETNFSSVLHNSSLYKFCFLPLLVFTKPIKESETSRYVNVSDFFIKQEE